VIDAPATRRARRPRPRPHPSAEVADPSRGTLVAIGLPLVALAIVTDGTGVLVAGTASERLRGHVGFLKAQRYVSGTVFVGLGVATALTGSHRSTSA
jgi:threonine/homoserine/homoserine lactone efflux protein